MQIFKGYFLLREKIDYQLAEISFYSNIEDVDKLELSKVELARLTKLEEDLKHNI